MTVLTVTDRASEKVRQLMAKRQDSCAGLRIGTATAGCNGLKYTLDYVEAPEPDDQAVEVGGVTFFIDAKSLQYLQGAEMDWEEDTFATGFTFNNPNEKGRCGCGESFSV